MLIFLLILAPLIEIVVLIEVGSMIGVWATIFLVLLTAIIGIGMLKAQGLDTFMHFQAVQARGELLAFELLERLLLLIGGGLLLVPGFITDLIGFLCLLRISRMWLIRLMVKNGLDLDREFTRESGRKGRDIEGTFRRHDDND